MKKIFFLLCIIPLSLISQNDGDSLFNRPIIHEISLDFSMTNFWDTLITNHDNDVYTLCNLTINGQIIDSIGVKLKGNSSYNNPSQKKSMKIDLNEFVSGKKYDGLKKFNLNNGFKDPSFLREKITLDLFNALGVPASRCSYANVYLNQEYWGFYTVVEEVNRNFLNQRFAENDSNLYKGDPQGDLRWKGNTPSLYYTDYEIDTKSDSSNDWRDLVHLIDKINNTPANQFYDSLEAVLNTYDFIRYWALTNIFTNLDSYVGSGHNYYLYHNVSSGKFEWITWDVNESFGNFKMNNTTQQLLDFNLFYTGSPNSRPLIEKMAQNSVYKTQLADYACEVLQTYFTEDWLFPKIDSLAAVIRPHVYADTKKFYTNQQFEDNILQTINTGGPGSGFTVIGIKPFIQGRTTSLLAQLQPYGCFAVSNENPQIENILIYPNPVESLLHLSLPNSSPLNAEFMLFSSIGTTLKDVLLSKEHTTISMEGLPQGIYHYEIRISGQNSISGKLVVR